MPAHNLPYDEKTHRRSSALRRCCQAIFVLALAVMALAISGCNKPKAMDVVWSADLVDENGFARNPVWQHTKDTGEIPNACNFCPCNSESPAAWSSAANCTSATLETNSSLECFGHWNWFPIEYEGFVTWGGHSNSWYDDDDYYFDVSRSDRALQTDGGSGPREVHLEFNSDETVDHWDDTGTWWDDFHHNAVDNNDQTAHQRIDNKDIIVVGLFGLDEQHHVPSEVHPVYAMFVHVQNSDTQDKWAFFVRNWGDEGYCGDNQENLDRRKMQIHLRHPVGGNFTLADNAWVYGDDEGERNQQSWSYQTVSDGLLLTFNLRDPSKQVGFVGDLTINWGAGGTGAAGAAGKSQTLPESTDGDAALKAKTDKLDPRDQKLLYQQVKALVHHPKALQVHPTKDNSTPAAPTKPEGKFPNYGAIVKKVADPAERARKEKVHAFVVSFLKAHGIE